MKLYATVNSERASKGQGGNEFLEIAITLSDGKKLPPIRSRITPLVGEDADRIDFYYIEKGVYHGIYEDIIVKRKGERQKGETVEKHPMAQYVDCKISGSDYCDKCGWSNH